jgi:DNA-directed RNA polymerase specialized sigma24 family protein
MRDSEGQVTRSEAPSASDAGALRDVHFARVASAEVRAAIVGRLRLRRTAPQEIDDLAGEVALALLAMVDVPATQAACLGAARDVTDKRVVSRIRSVTSRMKYVVGPTADADEHAGDADALPVAPAAFVREEKLQVFEASLTDGTVDARTAAMLRLQAQGRSIGEIAARLGVAAKTVRNTLAEGRRDVRAAWDARAARLGLAAGLDPEASGPAAYRPLPAVVLRAVAAVGPSIRSARHVSASLHGPTLPACGGHAVVHVPSSACASTERSRTSGPCHDGGACSSVASRSSGVGTVKAKRSVGARPTRCTAVPSGRQ